MRKVDVCNPFLLCDNIIYSGEKCVVAALVKLRAGLDWAGLGWAGLGWGAGGEGKCSWKLRRYSSLGRGERGDTASLLLLASPYIIPLSLWATDHRASGCGVDTNTAGAGAREWRGVSQQYCLSPATALQHCSTAVLQAAITPPHIRTLLSTATVSL